MDMYIIDTILITTRRKYFIFDLFNIYTKKEVKHLHVFLKWQIIQVSRDYWPDNLKNAMVTC
jgi:hypothetical protein